MMRFTKNNWEVKNAGDWKEQERRIKRNNIIDTIANTLIGVTTLIAMFVFIPLVAWKWMLVGLAYVLIGAFGLIVGGFAFVGVYGIGVLINKLISLIFKIR